MAITAMIRAMTAMVLVFTWGLLGGTDQAKSWFAR